jgi:hypothetical protein
VVDRISFGTLSLPEKDFPLQAKVCLNIGARSEWESCYWTYLAISLNPFDESLSFKGFPGRNDTDGILHHLFCQWTNESTIRSIPFCWLRLIAVHFMGLVDYKRKRSGSRSGSGGWRFSENCEKSSDVRKQPIRQQKIVL